MKKQVADVYETNRQRGRARWCGYEYDFVCPSTGTYPFQWFWDSCFHTVVLTHLDIRRAEQEIRSLLANAQPDGLIAHVTFWQRAKYEVMLSTYAIAYRTPFLSDCIQPPLLAEAVRAIMHRGGDQKFLQEILPIVRRYYDYLDRVRDPDQDGLISIIQADESGLDHSPKFDSYLGLTRPDPDDATAAWHRVADPYEAFERDPKQIFQLDRFNVEDVMVNTIYRENLSALAELCRSSGDRAAAEEYQRRGDKTQDALLEKCWDPEAQLFFDLAGKEERKLKTNTFTSLFPLLIPSLPRQMVEALVAQIRDPKKYGANYPIPTVALDEPSFVPGICGTNMVWRGPSWMNANWYLVRGLRRHGFHQEADQIVDRSVEMVEKSGLREYYNPESGEGYGAHHFSWTALILDLIAPEPF